MASQKPNESLLIGTIIGVVSTFGIFLLILFKVTNLNAFAVFLISILGVILYLLTGKYIILAFHRIWKILCNIYDFKKMPDDEKKTEVDDQSILSLFLFLWPLTLLFCFLMLFVIAAGIIYSSILKQTDDLS